MLIKAADLLVESSASIARNLRVPDLVIGLTVVAFGTSAPELFVNLNASIQGNADIAIGNILGSNIANIFLILGISSIIFPLAVSKGTVWKEIPLALLAAVVVGILANDRLIDKTTFSVLTKADGLVLISFFIIFIYYSLSISKNIDGLNQYVPAKQYGLMKASLFVILALIGLSIASKWIVQEVVYLAKNFGVSQYFVSLTVVAVGTSLPELATSVVAACKRNSDIAVGNILGSNIFNIFFILGMSSFIRPLPFGAKNNIDILILLFSTLLLFICMFTGKRQMLDRWEGMVFVSLYICYIAYLVIRG